MTGGDIELVESVVFFGSRSGGVHWSSENWSSRVLLGRQGNAHITDEPDPFRHLSLF